MIWGRILEGFWLNEIADYMVVYNATLKSLTHTSKRVRFFLLARTTVYTHKATIQFSCHNSIWETGVAAVRILTFSTTC